jgi:hypothetical protein
MTEKGKQIAKNAKSFSKLPKIGPNGLSERFLRVSPPLKAKMGSKYTILYHLNQHFFSDQFKNWCPHPFA